MSGRKVSLSEIMGKSGANAASSGLTLEKLPEILGELMPELPRNSVGRHRLVRSLQQRFGRNFRTLPGVPDLIKQFDTEVEFERKVEQVKQVRMKGKSNG